MPAEAIFPQEYFVYYKGKWCTAGGKDPLFGHVDGFQIGPNILKRKCSASVDYIAWGKIRGREASRALQQTGGKNAK